jgi:hypothetical protein
MSKDKWKSFDKQHGHEKHEAKFNILGPWRRWREKKREEKKRQLIAHQEAYAMMIKAEEHRKAEAVQRAKRQETLRMAEDIMHKAEKERLDSAIEEAKHGITYP